MRRWREEIDDLKRRLDNDFDGISRNIDFLERAVSDIRGAVNAIEKRLNRLDPPCAHCGTIDCKKCGRCRNA